MPPKQSKAVTPAKRSAFGPPVTVRYVDSTTVTTPDGTRINNYQSAQFTYSPTSKGSNKKK